MSRGGGTSDDLMSLTEIGNDAIEKIAELDVEKPVEFAAGFLEVMEGFCKQLMWRQAAVARAAHALSEAKGNQALFRIDMSMDKKLEITNKCFISVFEEFVEEYQDTLDTLRKDLAPYYSATTNHPQRPPLPLPPPIASRGMLPPPPIPDVDYDNDNDAFEKRREELCFYHGKQVDERNQIMEYRDAIDDHELDLCDEIDFALDLFHYRILRAVNFYTANNSGRSPYSDQATHEEYMRLINNNQKYLEAAGFDFNGHPI